MSHHWGYVSAVASALLFGVSSTLNKLALENVDPTLTAGLIYLIAGIVLFLIHLSPLCSRLLALFGTSETEAKINRKDWVFLAFVILCGSVIAPLLLLNGLDRTTAVNASLLVNAESFFTVVIALSFLGERCSKKEYIGVVLLLAGVVFLTTNGEFQRLTLAENLIGNLAVIGACLFWGIDNNLSKFLSKKQDILLVTGLKCFIGGTALITVSYFIGASFSVPPAAVPYLLSVGAFSIAFSLLFFLFSLRKIGSLRTGVIFSVSSLFGAAFALLILREAFTLLQLAAGLVMLAGVYVVYRCSSQTPPPKNNG